MSKFIVRERDIFPHFTRAVGRIPYSINIPDFVRDINPTEMEIMRGQFWYKTFSPYKSTDPSNNREDVKSILFMIIYKDILKRIPKV